MTRRTCLLAALLPTILLAASGLGFRSPGPEPAAVQWVGSDSKHEPGFVLVQTEQDWRILWAAHTGLASDAGTHGALDRHFAPKVDFARFSVVAYFRGPDTNRDGEVLQSILREPDQTTLRFEPSNFQTASFDGENRGVPTTSYGIWLIPRTAGSIAVEEARWGTMVEPMHYVEVARFGC